MGRLPKTEHERRNKPAESSLSVAEHQHLKECAASVKTRFTDYVRQIVLKDDLKLSPGSDRLRCSPGRNGKRLTIWLTLAEREELRSRSTALGITVSDYIYRALLAFTGFEADQNMLRLPLKRATAQRLARHAAAAGQPLGEFLLNRPSNGQPESPKVDSEILMKLDEALRELNAIGVNVNQLAHKANSGRLLPGLWQESAADLAEKTNTLDRVVQKVAASYGA